MSIFDPEDHDYPLDEDVYTEPPLGLYLISQDENTDYDTFDSAVVCSESSESAKLIHPGNYGNKNFSISWTTPENIKVKLIGYSTGEYKEGDVVCASFNAG